MKKRFVPAEYNSRLVGSSYGVPRAPLAGSSEAYFSSQIVKLYFFEEYCSEYGTVPGEDGPQEDINEFDNVNETAAETTGDANAGFTADARIDGEGTVEDIINANAESELELDAEADNNNSDGEGASDTVINNEAVADVSVPAPENNGQSVEPHFSFSVNLDSFESSNLFLLQAADVFTRLYTSKIKNTLKTAASHMPKKYSGSRAAKSKSSEKVYKSCALLLSDMLDLSKFSAGVETPFSYFRFKTVKSYYLAYLETIGNLDTGVDNITAGALDTYIKLFDTLNEFKMFSRKYRRVFKKVLSRKSSSNYYTDAPLFFLLLAHGNKLDLFGKYRKQAGRDDEFAWRSGADEAYFRLLRLRVKVAAHIFACGVNARNRTHISLPEHSSLRQLILPNLPTGDSRILSKYKILQIAMVKRRALFLRSLASHHKLNLLESGYSLGRGNYASNLRSIIERSRAAFGRQLDIYYSPSASGIPKYLAKSPEDLMHGDSFTVEEASYSFNLPGSIEQPPRKNIDDIADSLSLEYDTSRATLRGDELTIAGRASAGAVVATSDRSLPASFFDDYRRGLSSERRSSALHYLTKRALRFFSFKRKVTRALVLTTSPSTVLATPTKPSILPPLYRTAVSSIFKKLQLLRPAAAATNAPRFYYAEKFCSLARIY